MNIKDRENVVFVKNVFVALIQAIGLTDRVHGVSDPSDPDRPSSGLLTRINVRCGIDEVRHAELYLGDFSLGI